MKIAIISDTHTKHYLYQYSTFIKMPQADMLIHCGDISGIGDEPAVINFLKWFNNLDQYKYKIFIAGNHDWLFDTHSAYAKEILKNFTNVIYLQDSSVEIEGLKIYGTPVVHPFNNWAFNINKERLKLYWKAIPDDTDILITHEAPYLILDKSIYSNEHLGSESLYNQVVNRVKPKIHCFGHYHGSYGKYEMNGTTFFNASVLNDNYKIANNPHLIEI